MALKPKKKLGSVAAGKFPRQAEADPDSPNHGFELTWTDGKDEGGSYLLISRPGAGKTRLASQFPGERLWINIDRGLKTVRNLHDRKVDIRGSTDLWMKLLRLFWQIDAREGDFAKFHPKTLIVDDFSRLSQKLEVEVLENPPDSVDRSGAGKPEYLDAMRIQDYNTVGLRLIKIINAAKDIRGVQNFVACMGVNYEVDKERGLIDQPDATGQKLGPKIPHYFDSVIYMERIDNHFVSRIAPTKRFPYARIRFIGDAPLDLPTRIEGLTYELLKQIEEKKTLPKEFKLKKVDEEEDG